METDREQRTIRGQDLRYVLTLRLMQVGMQTVDELVSAVRGAGFEMGGRPSKAVSDALRWEIARGRVVRLGRGRYGPGTVPRSTRYWIRSSVRALSSDRCATRVTRCAIGRTRRHR
jgi:hypothetical protein